MSLLIHAQSGCETYHPDLRFLPWLGWVATPPVQTQGICVLSGPIRVASCFSMSDVTMLLKGAAGGDTVSLNRLYDQVYSELRAIAIQKMAAESPGHTLQPTALVNEAYLRLGGSGGIEFANRAHFFGAAAEAMRRILIECARRRLAAKRGAGVEVVDLDQIEIASPVTDDDRLLALNAALEKYAAVDPQKADLVKLRYFVGLSFEDAAAALGIAVPTAKRWWAYARVWLGVEMRGGTPG